MKEKFEPFFRKYAGSSWYGLTRTGFTGAAELCRKLDTDEAVMIKDRSKISTGITGGFFVKRYNMPGFFTQLRRRFKTSRTKIVLHGAEALEKLGITTPAVMAVAVETRSFFNRREFLITALLDEKDQLLNEFVKSTPPVQAWQTVREKLIPAVARIHEAGIAHGDLNMRNCFLSAGGEAGFIDLDGTKIYRGKVPGKIRCREIARLVSGFLLVAKCFDRTAEMTDEAVEDYRKLTGADISAADIRKATEMFISRRNK